MISVFISRWDQRRVQLLKNIYSISINKMPYDWDQCITEGQKSFDYMIKHFYEMFDETTINNFYIRYATNDMISYYEDVTLKYNTDIQIALIPWIKKEFEEKRLVNNTNWKPFRDAHDYNDMYLGYNKLFQYKQYYFLVALESGCVCEECIPINTCGHPPCFELALFGWKEDGSEKVQPYNIVIIDSVIPEKYWKLT